MRYDMEITFMEAAHGCEKEIAVPKLEGCVTCQGTGAEPGTKRRPVPSNLSRDTLGRLADDLIAILGKDGPPQKP